MMIPMKTTQYLQVHLTDTEIAPTHVLLRHKMTIKDKMTIQQLIGFSSLDFKRFSLIAEYRPERHIRYIIYKVTHFYTEKQ